MAAVTRAAPLAEPGALEARMALLDTAPRMRPLRDFAARIRSATGFAVPDADPLDGGVRARFLLLLETPGPRIGATGLVSRDNASGTGANLRRFLAEAGIARREMLIWNAVPWVIHAPGARNRAPTAAEQRAGLAWLPPLLDLLPRLAVVVLSGRIAAAARAPLHELRPELPVLAMPHPSPTYVCTSPEIPLKIRATLARAAALLRGESAQFPDPFPHDARPSP